MVYTANRGLYNPYHLLGEPETAIDFGLFFFSLKDGMKLVEAPDVNEKVKLRHLQDSGVCFFFVIFQDAFLFRRTRKYMENMWKI